MFSITRVFEEDVYDVSFAKTGCSRLGFLEAARERFEKAPRAAESQSGGTGDFVCGRSGREDGSGEGSGYRGSRHDIFRSAPASPALRVPICSAARSGAHAM